MNFFYIFFIHVLATDRRYSGLLQDPTVVDNSYIELSIADYATPSIKNYIVVGISKDIGENRLKEINLVIDSYMYYIREYIIEPSIHEFLEKFTILVCIIIYGSDTETLVKFRVELLTNIIAFGRFIELYRKESELGSIVKPLIKSFLINEFESLANTSKSYNKDMEEMSVIFNRVYEDIMNSNIKDFSEEIIELENVELSFDRIPETISNVQKNFNDASFERLFSFWLSVKYAYLAKNIFTLDDHQESKNKKFSLFLDNKFLNKISERDTRWQDSFYTKITPDLFQNMIKYIASPVIKKILTDEDKFQDILNFELNKNSSETVLPVDENFPTEFTNLFIEKSKSNQLIVIYNLLISVSKEEYHKCISAVICLKVLCFEKALSDNEVILRIIIEFLFFVDILNTEFEKQKYTEQMNFLSEEFKGVFDLSKLPSDLENQENDNELFLIETVAPKILNLIEMLVLINTFGDDVFLDKLDKCIIKVLNKTNNEQFELKSILDKQKEYVSFVFEEESKRYISSKSQNKQQENKNNKSKEENTSNFASKKNMFIILSILLLLAICGLCGYLLLRKRS
ncbi:hypothetical protein CWI37_0003p0030 [Hamiltosporidium tvaerminnensis]|uniref:Uncharacterized protein n=2 Tax=Hamiltosporidium TaxID=1176354 RepID=A0A4Q9LEW4_9MICR|nr:hypothetical protein LUQ84_001550 [Hamiltosporidium tvaerminnensis]TBU05530.1 hypothetical protein CWI37_0003p0030 [Hamiltosporidium tvaerminnensis]TBU06527.1 hypothetical protein CWI36_0432p0010 [Hamiltosporidium magnivora]